MTHQKLPPGLTPMGCSPTFNEETVPAALREEHALAPSHWGVLQLMEGSVCFVDLATGEQQDITAPELVPIAPEAPHKLCIDGPLTCRIDFFREDGKAGHRSVLIAADDEVILSFERCEAAGDFAERFYDIFMGASPEIAPHFANTDFERQRKLLRDSVYIMVTRDPRDVKMRETLERIGASHSRSKLDIPPRLFEIWLDSVCETVKELDSQWTEALDKQWRVRMRAGMQVITALY